MITAETWALRDALMWKSRAGKVNREEPPEVTQATWEMVKAAYLPASSTPEVGTEQRTEDQGDNAIPAGQHPETGDTSTDNPVDDKAATSKALLTSDPALARRKHVEDRMAQLLAERPPEPVLGCSDSINPRHSLQPLAPSGATQVVVIKDPPRRTWYQRLFTRRPK